MKQARTLRITLPLLAVLLVLTLIAVYEPRIQPDSHSQSVINYLLSVDYILHQRTLDTQHAIRCHTMRVDCPYNQHTLTIGQRTDTYDVFDNVPDLTVTQLVAMLGEPLGTLGPTLLVWKGIYAHVQTPVTPTACVDYITFAPDVVPSSPLDLITH